MVSIRRSFEAYVDDMNIITVLIPSDQKETMTPPFQLETETAVFPLSVREEYRLEATYKYVCVSGHPVTFGKTHAVRASSGDQTDLQIGAVIRTDAFDDAFYYDGELGAVYTADYTEFKVWAPAAVSAAVKLSHPSKSGRTFQMTRLEKGVYAVTVSGDLRGYEYVFCICNNSVWTETVDTYAKAVTVNGEKGVVLRPDQMKCSDPLKPFPNPADAVIYEMHIRDFSIHEYSGMKNKGKYLALTETDTQTTNGCSSGLAYVKELGVTHVELLPVNDFAGVDEKKPLDVYNWGYNPLHFFAPEGSYASNPHDPQTRKTELKQMIKTLHQHGLRVILDVVFNHVYERENSPFEKTVPGYFFRHDAFGMPSNGTGVGNDIASERRMARKFIADCVIYWLQEYDADGFRFDLLGILDIDTVLFIKEKAMAAKPGILLFGEGWDLNTPLPHEQKAILANASKMPGIGFFNDMFRDAVKGNTFQLMSLGFALGSGEAAENVMHGIAGSSGWRALAPVVPEPSQSINYVESHDNHTFWDKMSLALPQETDSRKRSRQRLASAIILLAQGVPFIHSGQEFFRTKQGVENSYQSSDSINQLDWDRREMFKEDVDYFRRLISLRKAHPAFRLRSAADIRRHLECLTRDEHLIAYRLHNLNGIDEWEDVIVIHHASPAAVEWKLPNDKTYQLLCDTSGFQRDPKEIKKAVAVMGIGTVILYLASDLKSFA
ncbi:type I pullulanase [Bacillus tequilensis]|uniref:type I pullulanase n=1 Tax=Bacillus tequilensis TaxID=227866 RepID=UPI00157565EE|nr:type I pullulanase [Bacillus tequilensis]NTU24677.1 type I pullulanase [Bacillus tequilensis]